MSNWYDRAEQELKDSLAKGEITLKEYNYEMRELNREYSESQSRDNGDDFY